MVILIAFRAFAHIPGYLYNEFRPQWACNLFIIDDCLHQPGRITHIKERHSAVITAAVYPAADNNCLSDKRFRDVGTMMCTISCLAHFLLPQIFTANFSFQHTKSTSYPL